MLQRETEQPNTMAKYLNIVYADIRFPDWLLHWNGLYLKICHFCSDWLIVDSLSLHDSEVIGGKPEIYIFFCISNIIIFNENKLL